MLNVFMVVFFYLSFIFQDVIEVSQKYLPNMAKGFDSPKLTQHIGDGFEYLKQHENEFDVIITDSSDPVGKFNVITCHCCVFLSKFTVNISKTRTLSSNNVNTTIRKYSLRAFI